MMHRLFLYLGFVSMKNSTWQCSCSPQIRSYSSLSCFRYWIIFFYRLGYPTFNQSSLLIILPTAGISLSPRTFHLQILAPQDVLPDMTSWILLAFLLFLLRKINMLMTFCK